MATLLTFVLCVWVYLAERTSKKVIRGCFVSQVRMSVNVFNMLDVCDSKQYL